MLSACTGKFVNSKHSKDTTMSIPNNHTDPCTVLHSAELFGVALSYFIPHVNTVNFRDTHLTAKFLFYFALCRVLEETCGRVRSLTCTGNT